MDVSEMLKWLRRSFDGNISKRKLILIVLIVLIFILYLGPIIFQWMWSRPGDISKNPLNQILSYRLERYLQAQETFDSNVQHVPHQPDDRLYLPYVGNGYFGAAVSREGTIMIKNGRTLQLPVPFRPFTLLSLESHYVEEAIVTDYKNGIIYRWQIWDSSDGNAIEINYQSYAHRTLPSLLVQDIKITNPSSVDIVFEMERLGLSNWESSSSRRKKIQHGNGDHEYLIVSGLVKMSNSDKVVAVSIVTLNLPPSIEVKKRVTTTLHVFTSINYSDPIPKESFSAVKIKTEASALKSLKSAVTGDSTKLRRDHTSVWQSLWLSGFGISESKADNALNGDLINATIYNVLSQTRALLHEVGTPVDNIEQISRDLAYAEGCYDGPHTLQAKTLWSNLESLEDINNIVSLWLMTLEKQGCYQLLRAGADGVMQAMLLSLGGFQFSNQHLQFNVDPSHLHRDYFFRRISYGKMTHLNVSVVVQDDYKAALYVTLDRASENYYGCDAGCLDPPVQLGPQPIVFPVKKTDPLTAILYITSDKVHMEELKHTIHVQEIGIAPPHEQHVIAIHKHGHRFGGLPSIFWLAIVALIAIFHLFLFKIVINEYCGSDVRVKYRIRVVMEKGGGLIDKRPQYTASFARSSKAIGVLWGVFTICFAIIVVVVFIQPQWIGDTDVSKGSGYFGLWQVCSPATSGNPNDALCQGNLKELDSIISLPFKSATLLVASAVVASLLCVCCLLLFFFFSPAAVFNVAGVVQLFAAIFLLVGICIYPMGFDAPEVAKVCGQTARAYNLGECEVRWAYLLAILGILDSAGLSALAFLLASRSRKLKQHIYVQQQQPIEPIYGNSIYKGQVNGEFIGDGMSITGSRKSLNLQPVVMFPRADQDNRSEYSHLPRSKTPALRSHYATPSQHYQF